MRELLGHVDRLLRGGYTRREDLLEGRVTVASRTLATAGLVLGAVYGLFMGVFAAMRTEHPSWPQLLATMVKVPLLFLLTLVVTFPSLYVFSALSNSRLRGPDTLRLLLAAVTVNLALLASFGPVTGFFTLSTDSYPFLVILNVAFFAISGFAGLTFLRRALTTLFEAPQVDEPERDAPPPPLAADLFATSPRESPLPPMPTPTPSRSPSNVALSFAPPPDDPGRRVFRVWIVTYCVVGAQMAWILRPFIGTPGLEFSFFRPRGSNFLEALWHTLQRLFN
ncbi:MAG: hypothetical protein K8T90_14930 [Planctomycetes bacterium]|nr:hypothetical protein [Planctomycetota bacterium]